MQSDVWKHAADQTCSFLDKTSSEASGVTESLCSLHVLRCKTLLQDIKEMLKGVDLHQVFMSVIYRSQQLIGSLPPSDYISRLYISPDTQIRINLKAPREQKRSL